MKAFLLLLCTAFVIHCSAQGIITTVAGGGIGGDGGLATNAFLEGPNDVAVDDSGNIYIADFNVIRKVDAASGIIHTIVGGGSGGDNVPATQTYLAGCQAIAFDSHHNLYIAADQRIRKVDATTGIITTIAGIGIQGCTGDGGPATAAKIGRPEDLAIDTADNLYIADGGSVIRKVNLNTGIISTIIGVYGQPGNWTYGAIHLNTTIGVSRGICVDKKGNIYFADGTNRKIGKINSAGVLTTYCGTGVIDIPLSGDGGLAINATTHASTKIRMDKDGNMLIPDVYIRRIDNSNGIISRVAGIWGSGFSGDGGNALLSLFNGPVCAFPDNKNNVFIVDQANFRIRKFAGVVGITEPKQIALFKLYPNPSNGIFSVISNRMINEVTVYNSVGQLVYKAQQNNDEMVKINIEEQPPGIYLLSLRINNEIFSERISINY